MDNNNYTMLTVFSTERQQQWRTDFKRLYLCLNITLCCHLERLYKQWDLCTIVSCACTWTTLYGLWTEAITGVEYLFFNQNSVQYQWIRKDLVISILYDGQWRAWWSYFIILLVAVILQRQKVMRYAQFYWTKGYRICSIRRRGYYSFHCAILCGFNSRAAFIKLGNIFPNCKGFEKSFYKINEELWCDDLV